MNNDQYKALEVRERELLQAQAGVNDRFLERLERLETIIETLSDVEYLVLETIIEQSDYHPAPKKKRKRKKTK